MISNHIKKGFWLWTAACLVLWGLSRAPQFQQFADQMTRVSKFGWLGGTAIAVIALLIVGYIERSRAAKRLTELYGRVQSGEIVEIHGGSGLPRLIVLSALAWIFVVALGGEPASWMLQAPLGIGVAIVSLFELLTVIPLLRQPVLRISRESLQSPIFGELSWQDIQGFALAEAELRGFSFHHRVNLSIPSLPSRTAQLHPAARLKQRIRSIFRPSTTLGVRLLRASEMPKVILTLCQRISSAYTTESQREQVMKEMAALLESTGKPSSRVPTQAEAKMKAEMDAVGIAEWLRQQQQETHKRRDEMWEWKIAPPPELMRTHWTTWVAAAVFAAFIAWFGYQLYRNPL